MTTEFTGGTLADLKALSPSLTFGHLVLSGGLMLETGDLVTLNVTSLTVPATGGIGYDYGTCEYLDAPTLTINATADVTILGDISLRGRSGDRVSASASCNSPYGQDGGRLTIDADGNIRIGSKVTLSGGAGGQVAYSYGCSGGDAGAISLTGASIDLSGSTIDASAGDGGAATGPSGGTPIAGADGAATPSDFRATDLFRMEGGSVEISGVLTLLADRSQVCGPLYCSTLTHAIGGLLDTTQPTVSILSPTASTPVPCGAPSQISVQVGDVGVGVREVHLVGLGKDAVYPASLAVGGVLTVNILGAALPNSLTATVTDNAGLTRAATLTGIPFAYTLEVEPNTDSAPQTLQSTDMVKGDVQASDTGSSRSFGSGLGPRTFHDWYRIPLPYTAPVGRTWTDADVKLDFTGAPAGTNLDLVVWWGLYGASTYLGSGLRNNAAIGDYTESVSFRSQYMDASSPVLYVAVSGVSATTRATYVLSISFR